MALAAIASANAAETKVDLDSFGDEIGQGGGCGVKGSQDEVALGFLGKASGKPVHEIVI